jgi:MoaA/NifB/PqqE/SkfB family radical SAM enzyme
MIKIPKYATNMARNIAYRTLNRAEKIAYHPVMCCYSITYRCNLQCYYCYENSRIHGLAELDTSGVITTLEGIRKCCDIIALSGGEPTLRPDLGTILEACQSLGFEEIILNTNGLDLDMDANYLKATSRVMLGVDSLREEGFKRITSGTSEQYTRQMEILELAYQLQDKYGFDLSVCAVLLPGKLGELDTLLDWCFDREVAMSLSPQLAHRKVPDELKRDPEYPALISRLQEYRRQGRPLMGSTAYFEALKDLEPFACYPMSNLCVNPLGEIQWPCPEINQRGPSFVEGRPYHQMVDEVRKRFGDDPGCQFMCHHSCYLPLSLAIAKPWLLPEELINVQKYNRRGKTK